MKRDPNSEPAPTCPSCRSENPPGAIFCQACGLRLSRICAKCRSEIAVDARFCHHCGQAVGSAGRHEKVIRTYTPKHLTDEILTRRSALEGEHKQVTVLFADIKGSMELAEQIDPEDWHTILDNFFRILADGIHRFDGTINQYTGDGVMALFGAPIAHEDHALKACQAALYLRAELRRHADQLRIRRGLNFGVRIGLNSGQVVVGRIGDDLRMDYTAQGRTVGLAARMEQLAASGCVYLTEHTAKLIEGFFRVRDLGMSKVKGVRGPLRVYELEGVRNSHTRFDTARERGFSRFVGRQAELNALQSTYRRVLDGRGQVVGMVGEPGVGKSRLCYEFLEIMRESGATICRANCASHTQAVPLLPVSQLLRSIFGVSGQEPEEETRKKIAGTLVLLDEAFQDALSVWFDFLAVADPQQPLEDPDPDNRQRQLFAMIQRLVQTLARQAPLIIMVDDLHWIDPSSDALITRLVDAVKESRTLLLLNFRPEYQRDWMTRSLYRSFPLPALNPDGARELMDDLLGHDPSTQDLAPRLLARALGNPFFIEELIRSLTEAGHLKGRPGAYRLVKPVKTQTLPRSVQTVLAARIDRLGESAKLVLQTASVIGQEFEETILSRTADLYGKQFDNSITQLKEVEFFYQKDFYPQAVFAFRHPIVREVAYHTLLKKPRARLHRRAALAIESVHGDRRDEFAATAAYHWEKADDPLTAARWHGRAARAAGFAEVQSTFFHWVKALRLALQGPDSEEAIRLQLEACCGALDVGGRVDISPEQAGAIFEQGRRLAEKVDDSRALLRLHEDWAARLGWSGDFAGQRRYLDAASKIAEKVADPATKLGLLQRRYVAQFHQGDLKSALKLIEQGIAGCKDSQPVLPLAVFNRILRSFLLAKGNVLSMMGRLEAAESYIEQAADLRPAAGGPPKDSRTTHTEALVRANLSIYSGDIDACRRDARFFAELAERSGSVWADIVSASTTGRAHLTAQSWREARESLEYALAQAREHQLGLEAEASFMALLAEAMAGCGQQKRALEIAEEAVAVARRKETLFWELQARLALAGVLMCGRDKSYHPRISDALARADELIQATGGALMKPFVTQHRAELAGLQGDDAGRRQMLHQAQQEFLSMAARGHAARLKALLDSIESEA